jgi:hypothetical protein
MRQECLLILGSGSHMPPAVSVALALAWATVGCCLIVVSALASRVSWAKRLISAGWIGRGPSARRATPLDVFGFGLSTALTGFYVAVLILTDDRLPVFLIVPLAFGPLLIPIIVRALRKAT